MKRSFLILILATLLYSSCPIRAHAQNYESVPVEISEEKVKMDGQIFYVHKVLKKQTLYSIARKYKVSVDELYKYNKDAQNGLKEGSFLYIPMSVNSTALPSGKADAVQKFSGKQVLTKSDLSRKELRKLKKHKVKWYETLDDIAARYTLDKNIILSFNELSSQTLKKRQVLYIPDKDLLNRIVTDTDKKRETDKKKKPENSRVAKSAKTTATVGTVTAATAVSQQKDGKIQEQYSPALSCQEEDLYAGDEKKYTYDGSRSYKISVILPLKVTENSTTSSSNYMDMYAGMLQAVHDLSAQYDLSSYTLNVIDQSAYASSEEIIDSGELDESELIIGPILIKDIAPIAEYAREERIPMVSPLDTRSEKFLDENPYFFLFPVLNEIADQSLLEVFTEESDFHKGNLFVSAEDRMPKATDYIDFLEKYRLDDRATQIRIRPILDSLKHLEVMDEYTLTCFELLEDFYADKDYVIRDSALLASVMPDSSFFMDLVQFDKDTLFAQDENYSDTTAVVRDSLFKVSKKELALQRELKDKEMSDFMELFWTSLNESALPLVIDTLNGRFCNIDLLRCKEEIKEFAVCHPRGLKNLLIYNEEDRYKKELRSLINQLREEKVNFDTLSYNILNGRGIDSMMFFKLDTLGHNKVLIASRDEAFISDALRNLHLLKTVEDISIDVYGPARWRNYQTIELKNLHSLNTHLKLCAYINYNDLMVKDFIQEYRTIFKAEPTDYAYRGYDIATCFISLLHKYGREFPQHVRDEEFILLQNNVKFRKTGKNSGFRNEATKNISYLPGWEIIDW